MDVIPTEIPDVKILLPPRHGDPRGFFSETWSRRSLDAVGIHVDFVQDNHSLSRPRGVLRGLHYQLQPRAQDKLLRVVRGSILDIALDIRRSSPTFGKHVAQIISAENWRQIFVPSGFAHGFVTLEPETEVIYKVTSDYSPEHERGILWNDPALFIDWKTDSPVLSPRDTRHPTLANQPDLFD